MPYDGKILARARAALEQRRADNQNLQQQRTELVYARVPEIRQIDRELTGQMAQLARLTFTPGPDQGEKLKALREANLDLQMRRAELLVGHGYPITYLDEIFSCPLCQDRGQTDGQICQCLKTLYNRELTKELGTLLRTGEESFERFDLTLYDAQPASGAALSARDHMEKVYQICRKFADNFPNVSANLLFQGGTGLGKTYLSACSARVVADRGYSVCYDSCTAALEAFEQQKFAREPGEAEAAEDRVRRMLDCDLMILDDLGTEMLTSMSSSALYTLLNTRLTQKKRLIISTNLSDEELKRRYSPQIVSRLLGEFQSLPFVGRDIRLLHR